MTTSGEEPPLKLLALDGGGIRGLSELLIIREVMHRVLAEGNAKRREEGKEPLSSLPKPCDYFDLIGGTSTGGIIALMLGRLRMDVDDAIQHYDDLAKQVFSDMKRWGLDGKFKATKLEKAIKSVVETVSGNAETPLLEEGDEAIVCRTFVCAKNALNMNANIPVLFRTYHSRETHSGCKIWEAARATSAAPTFFKRIEIGRNQPYIDGGLGRNNPSRVVLDEAKALFGDRQIGCLLSIGTGQAEVTSIERPGFFQQIVPMDVINALKAITTDCEATHEEMTRLFANLPNTYFRLNVEQGMQGIELSEWEKLGNVEAHTVQYMRKNEVNEKITLLVNTLSGIPSARLTLQELISPRPPINSVRHARERKHCPLPVSSFTGRQDILDKMGRYFATDCDSQRVFVLHGLGGSGKSQLAFKFVKDSSTCFSDVFYIDATNEQTLQMDLKAIAPSQTEQSVDASLRWLANHPERNWLLVFDNADDVNLKLKKFFPPCASGNILVATRNQELCHYSGKDADENVTGMDPKDATTLLLNQAREEECDKNRALAGEIVKELHYFALAVSQAGAYIHCHSSLRKYREFYLRERDNLLQHVEFQGSDPYERAVYATWRLSYEKLNASARTFLQICSILHHKGIFEEMFEKAALSQFELEDSELQNEVTRLLNCLGKQDSGWSSWVFTNIIKRLRSYSLIEYDSQNDTYSIHPLVQHWSSTTMGEKKYFMHKCVLTIISRSSSWMDNSEDYAYRCKLLQHISNCMALLNLEEITSSILAEMALVYREQGHWKEAEKLVMVVLEKRKYTLGVDHPDTLVSMANLASIYRDQGRWKEAEALEVAVLEKRTQLLGEDHPNTLISMNNLASTYWNQGHWKEAEVLEVVVLEKRKQMLGEDHPDTLISMGNLASTYRNQGRWEEAEKLEVVVVEKRKHVLGYDHPSTLASMANLAATYGNQGRWEDAEGLEVAVMEKSKQMLGDDHPETLQSMNNLASTYRDQGRWQEAEALQVVVMEKRKQFLGDDHPNTLTSMANLAATYMEQGRLEEAEVLEVVVLEKRRQVLGEDHPNTLTSMANLASTYMKQCRWEEAEALEVVALEKMKRVLGEDHPDTLLSMTNLAVTYCSQERWEEAEALEVVVMEKRKHVLGEDHPDTLSSMANLAATYMEQGRLEESEVLEVVVLEKRRQVLGEDHLDTLSSMASLAVTYWSQERWKEAEKLGVVVLEKRKQMLGEDDPDTLNSMGNLASTYCNQGRWKEAEKLEVVVVEKRKQVLGEDDPDTLTSMNNLASIYMNQGRLEEANALNLVVLEKRERVLGEDHPDTLESMKNLAVTYREQGRLEEAEMLEGVVEKKRK